MSSVVSVARTFSPVQLIIDEPHLCTHISRGNSMPGIVKLGETETSEIYTFQKSSSHLIWVQVKDIYIWNITAAGERNVRTRLCVEHAHLHLTIIYNTYPISWMCSSLRNLVSVWPPLLTNRQTCCCLFPCEHAMLDDCAKPASRSKFHYHIGRVVCFVARARDLDWTHFMFAWPLSPHQMRMWRADARVTSTGMICLISVFNCIALNHESRHLTAVRGMSFGESRLAELWNLSIHDASVLQWWGIQTLNFRRAIFRAKRNTMRYEFLLPTDVTKQISYSKISSRRDYDQYPDYSTFIY